MSNHSVSISQLMSVDYNRNSANAFLNVDESVYGAIAVWGSCFLPTYILKRGQEFRLIQFSSIECSDEWFANKIGRGYEIIKITADMRLLDSDDLA